ncbi:MAG: MlaD family protein [Aeromicrobium sp.]
MITRLTKIQLVIFAIITLLGGAFVGGRYAKVDRLVVDRSFPVYAQFKDSGGIFVGAQVTYRGIGVGRVGKLTFKDSGVRARIDIENSAPKVPADTLAVVANKSAVGEQFIDLQPRVTTAPYLKSGTFISEANTRIPISTTNLLIDINNLVKSIDTGSLKTAVNELGTAFNGTGEDLGRIIDTSTEFIQAANDNIDTTKALINDSSSVLQTQIDKSGAIATFSKNLALLSDTLVSSDPDLRRLFAGGAGAAKVLRQVIDENSADLSTIIRNVITTNHPAYLNVQAVRALFILYPYVVEGAYTVTADSGVDENGKKVYNANFGLVVTPQPDVCQQGYRSDRRPPEDTADREFDITADCTDAALVARNPSKTTVANRAPVAVYNTETGSLTSTSTDANGLSPALTSSSTLGKDSWKWLLLGPATLN